MADAKMDIENGNEFELRSLDPSLFDPPLDNDYICAICLYAVYRPLNLSCAHLFCQPCIKQALQSQRESEREAFNCPSCRTVTPRLNPDDPHRIASFINRRINGNYKIKCPNNNDGCAIVLDCLGTDPERGRLMDHLNECDYEIIECEDCGEEMQNAELADHEDYECMERLVKCEYCKKKMTERNRIKHEIPSEINAANKEQSAVGNKNNKRKKAGSAAAASSSSSLLIRGCNNRSYCSNKTNGCEWIGLNVELNKHINDCDKEVISCSICNKRLFREESSSHNNAAVEMHSMIQLIEKRSLAREQKLQQIIERLEKKSTSNGITCTLTYALPINSISSGRNFSNNFSNNWVSLTDSLKVRLSVGIDQQDNVGLFLRNNSSHTILATSVIGQLLQWKHNKLVIVKQLLLENQPIVASNDLGWYTFVPTANWKNASLLNDWASPLPPSDSAEHKLFDIYDPYNAWNRSSNERYLLFLIKATVSSVTINGKTETDHALINVLKELQQ